MGPGVIRNMMIVIPKLFPLGCGDRGPVLLELGPSSRLTKRRQSP
jgi:hypothetical protein